MSHPSSNKPEAPSSGFLHAFNCRHTVDLISRSLDEKLPAGQRILLHIHLFLCRLCRQYRRQLLFLKTALPKVDDLTPPGQGPELSSSARDRIQSALRKEKEEGS